MAGRLIRGFQKAAHAPDYYADSEALIEELEAKGATEELQTLLDGKEPFAVYINGATPSQP